MKAHPGAAWFVLAIDMPFFDVEAAKYLVASRDPNKLATVFVEPTHQLPEPLCAIYESAILMHLLQAVATDKTCPRGILKHLDIARIEACEAKWLHNVNTPGEYDLVMTMQDASVTRGKESKTISLRYFAQLRDQRGVPHERVATNVHTTKELYDELQTRHGFTLSHTHLRVAVNNAFTGWTTELRSGDEVVFLPPVSGG
jgi:molybdopterin-guanine dinucleotide biosynthesis protein A